MKKFVTACALALAFMVGACSPVSEVVAEQKRPLKISFENNNGSMNTYFVWDENTGVNYVVVENNFYRGGGVAITPRLNADGSLYVGK